MRGTVNAERLAQAKCPFVFAAAAVALWGNARIIRHPLERVSVSGMRGREGRQEPLITTQHRTVSASDRLLDACAAGDAKRIRRVLDGAHSEGGRYGRNTAECAFARNAPA